MKNIFDKHFSMWTRRSRVLHVSLAAFHHPTPLLNHLPLTLLNPLLTIMLMKVNLFVIGRFLMARPVASRSAPSNNSRFIRPKLSLLAVMETATLRRRTLRRSRATIWPTVVDRGAAGWTDQTLIGLRQFPLTLDVEFVPWNLQASRNSKNIFAVFIHISREL